MPPLLTNEHDACSQLCQRYGLELLSLSPRSFSRYVARVRDNTGRILLLKQASSAQQGASEAGALRVWDGTGAAARLIEELEDGAYLAEWLDGIPLAEVPAAEPVDLVAVGRMLRALHGATTPNAGPDIRDRLRESSATVWLELTPEMRAHAEQAAVRLRRLESPPVLLHGDLVPTNVVLTRVGPKVIDPEPSIGTSAWDVAQLAVAAAGRGRFGAIRPLLEGYGSEPPLLAEMYAWMVLWFLKRNLTAGRTEFSDNLRPLADELIREGNPEQFFRMQLAL